MVFISLFVIHLELFPSKFLNSSYGICNVVSRIVTLGAPIAAEIPNRLVPIGLMIAFNIVALVAAYFLRLNKK